MILGSCLGLCIETHAALSPRHLLVIVVRQTLRPACQPQTYDDRQRQQPLDPAATRDMLGAAGGAMRSTTSSS